MHNSIKESFKTLNYWKPAITDSAI